MKRRVYEAASNPDRALTTVSFVPFDIDYVSKNLQGTIGKEKTCFKEKLEERDHRRD